MQEILLNSSYLSDLNSLRKFLFLLLLRIYFTIYISSIENIPVRIEIVARFVSQHGAKVKAAFVDEKFDELSKKSKKREEKKKDRYICRRGWNTMLIKNGEKNVNAFSPGD